MTPLQETQVEPSTLFTITRRKDNAVVRLFASSVGDKDAAMLARYLSDVASRNNHRLILHLAGVEQFSCAWINALIGLSKRCAQMRGGLVLVGLSRPNLRLLRSTGLMRYFMVATTEDEAAKLLAGESIAAWRILIARLLDLPVSERPSTAAA